MLPQVADYNDAFDLNGQKIILKYSTNAAANEVYLSLLNLH